RSGEKASAPPAKSERPEKSEAAAYPIGRTTTVLAADGPPPLIVILDESGAVKLAAVDRWSDLATGTQAGSIAGDLDTIHKIILQAEALGQTPKQAMAEMAKGPDVPLEPNVSSDDPGTGQAMTLEEGKMTKKGAPSPPEDPAFAKRREALPITGRRGLLDAWGSWTDYKSSKHKPGSRDARIAGEVVADGKLLAQRAAILASPRAKAEKLIAALELTEAAIVVGHDRTIRPLRINFRGERDSSVTPPEPKWIEARLSATGVTIAAVPAEPVVIEWAKWPIDQPRLEGALANARQKHKLDPRAPVDVLVDPDIGVQRLVDLLVALDAANVAMIGLGLAKDR
ncbi:MAG TPA: hypothetical protein VIU61_17110, partial [Kofleriaceae bacterium]